MAKKARKPVSAQNAAAKPIKPSAAIVKAQPAAAKPMAYPSQPAGYQYNNSALTPQAAKPQPGKPATASPTININRTPGLIKPMGVINYGGYNSSPTALKGASNNVPNERAEAKPSPLYPRTQEKPSR